MKKNPVSSIQLPATRRDFLKRSGVGMGTLGLAGILSDETSSLQAANTNPMAPKKPHFPGKAKAVIHLFLNGGPSQVDTFDPKPKLQEYHGKAIPLDLRTERETGVAYQSPFHLRNTVKVVSKSASFSPLLGR